MSDVMSRMSMEAAQSPLIGSFSVLINLSEEKRHGKSHYWQMYAERGETETLSL